MQSDIDEWISHYIELEYYANGFSEYVMDMLLSAEGDCDDIILSSDYYNTKGQYGKAAKGIKERTESLMDEIKSYIDGESEGVVSKELDWLLAISGGILAYRQAIMPSKVLFTPFNGRDTVDTFRAKLFVEHRQGIRQRAQKRIHVLLPRVRHTPCGEAEPVVNRARAEV